MMRVLYFLLGLIAGAGFFLIAAMMLVFVMVIAAIVFVLGFIFGIVGLFCGIIFIVWEIAGDLASNKIDRFPSTAEEFKRYFDIKKVESVENDPENNRISSRRNTKLYDDTW